MSPPGNIAATYIYIKGKSAVSIRFHFGQVNVIWKFQIFKCVYAHLKISTATKIPKKTRNSNKRKQDISVDSMSKSGLLG